MSNSANTQAGARIIVAPAPQSSNNTPVEQKTVLQAEIEISQEINIYTDMPDGDCPGYTQLGTEEELIKEIPQERGVLLTYRDGTETLNQPIDGIGDILYSHTTFSSDDSSRFIDKILYGSSLIDDRPLLGQLPSPGVRTPNILIGTERPDILDASNKDSGFSISGQGNIDTIYGSNHNDVIFGGYIGSTASDRNWTSTISIDTATNTIVGGAGDDTIIAGSIGDLIWGEAQDTTNTTATAGNNLIYTGGGKDTVYSGNGNNTIYVSDGHHNSITSSTTQANINTGSGNDSIVVSANGKNTINAGNGNDTVNIQDGKGAYIVNSGDGNNLITVNSSSNQQITTGSGNDTITLDGASTTSLNAGLGNNSIQVNSGKNTITSISSDEISLNAGANDIILSKGSNASISLNHSDAITYLQLDNGSGQLSSTLANGNDFLGVTGHGTITLNLGAGNNSVVSNNTGNTTISTAAGNDTIFINNNGNSSITDTGGSNKISLSSGNDTLTLTHGDNSVTISGGNNKITLSNTNVQLHSGSGSDTVILSGTVKGSLDLGNGKTDVLTLSQGTTLDHSLSITDVEALYIQDTSGSVSISQNTILNMAKTGANFYNVKLGSTLLTNQVLLSGSSDFSGIINIDVLNTDPMIIGSQEIPGVGKIYLVSVTPPGASGALLAIPDYLMDNIAINNGSYSFTLESIIGSKFDQSVNPFVNVTPGSDNQLLSSGQALSSLISGKNSKTLSEETENIQQPVTEQEETHGKEASEEKLSTQTDAESQEKNTAAEHTLPEQKSTLDSEKDSTQQNTNNNLTESDIFGKEATALELFAPETSSHADQVVKMEDISSDIDTDSSQVLLMTGTL